MPDPTPDVAAPTGADLARQMLNLARAEARKKGTGPAKRPKTRRRVQLTGGRDPQTLGNVVDQLADAFGWTKPSAGAQVIIRWSELAPELVRHAVPERYDAETRTLHLRPVSPTSATHLRLNAARIASDLNERAGAQTITTIRVLAPGRTAPADQDAPAVPREPTPQPTPADPGAAHIQPTPGRLAAQEILITHQQRPRHDPTKETRDRYFADVRGTLREPEHAFTDAVVFHQDLAEKAAAAEDLHNRALARARAERAGRAPALPRVFDQTG